LFCLALSCPALSTHALLSGNVTSCIFQPCCLVRYFCVRRWLLVHSQGSPHPRATRLVIARGGYRAGTTKDSEHFCRTTSCLAYSMQPCSLVRYFHSRHWLFLHFQGSPSPSFPLPSNGHHRRKGDCLEGKRENYQMCSVQYCVQQLCTVQRTHMRSRPNSSLGWVLFHWARFTFVYVLSHACVGL